MPNKCGDCDRVQSLLAAAEARIARAEQAAGILADPDKRHWKAEWEAQFDRAQAAEARIADIRDGKWTDCLFAVHGDTSRCGRCPTCASARVTEVERERDDMDGLARTLAAEYAALREALRDRAKQAHYMTIEAWRGIKPPVDSKPHSGMFDECSAEKCVAVRAALAPKETPEGRPA